MKNLISNQIKANLAELALSIQNVKNATTEKNSNIEKLFHNVLSESVALYVDNKSTFTTYKKFVHALNTELVANVDENQVTQLKIIDLINYTLINGNYNLELITYKQIIALEKVNDFISTTQLKNAKKLPSEDYGKAINVVINEAKSAYEIALFALNEATIKHLETKSIVELEILIDLSKRVKAHKVKAETALAKSA